MYLQTANCVFLKDLLYQCYMTKRTPFSYGKQQGIPSKNLARSGSQSQGRIRSNLPEKKCTLFTHGAPRSSQELIQKCPCIQESYWNLEMLVFNERRKPEYLERTSRSRVEKQQQTQPTYNAESGNRTRYTFMGGERSHHCAISAPPLIRSFPFNKFCYQ